MDRSSITSTPLDQIGVPRVATASGFQLHAKPLGALVSELAMCACDCFGQLFDIREQIHQGRVPAMCFCLPHNRRLDELDLGQEKLLEFDIRWGKVEVLCAGLHFGTSPKPSSR